MAKPFVDKNLEVIAKLQVELDMKANTIFDDSTFLTFELFISLATKATYLLNMAIRSI